MSAVALDRSRSISTPWIAAAGLALGAIYTLSPFTVLFALAVVPLVRWAARGIEGRERQWLMAVLVAAVAARLLVVVGLFLVTDHHQVPFGSLFGDEEYFIRRSLWLRNIALGFPVHRADFIYAFDDYSRTSFLYVLAILQALFGPAPYGAHLFSIVCYLAACVILFRVVRPAYGRLPAFVGLATLLFLPSLFAWSISALKEPLYFLAMSVGLAAAVTAGRPGPALRRVAAVVTLVAIAFAAQSIREGGLAMAAAGAVSGLAVGIAWRRPRLLLAAALVCVVAVPLIAFRGKIEDRVVAGVRTVASVHWGHVNTPGYVYTILEGSFYTRRAAINEMTFRQGAQYVIGSLVTYVAVPVPWRIESRSALTYLPEQVVWYAIVLLVPIGVVSGFRRDPLLTALLLAYASTAALLVAVTSGNIGTLVRHRGLALPYLIWLSILGARDLVAWLTFAHVETYADHR